MAGRYKYSYILFNGFCIGSRDNLAFNWIKHIFLQTTLKPQEVVVWPGLYHSYAITLPPPFESLSNHLR
ncbi:hypothetical protein Naga_101219g2 [Nannochloropsis gaditana]|uniref:Uncharacterized protein n=1 Tax=Nannochloropsis gaditana TaxID=72520 RepID=W7TQM2_9STRA|nr:hypothetical protein Naga_101219g2 [Nannochloropsis gaditana]